MTKPAKNAKAEPVIEDEGDVDVPEAVPADVEVTPREANHAGWQDDIAQAAPLVVLDDLRRDRVIEEFMAGRPTYGPAPSPFPADPLDITETVFGDGVYVYPVKLVDLQTDPVYGNGAPSQPDDMTAGQYVRIESGGSFAHVENSLWVAGKTPSG